MTKRRIIYRNGGLWSTYNTPAANMSDTPIFLLNDIWRLQITCCTRRIIATSETRLMAAEDKLTAFWFRHFPSIVISHIAL